MTKLLAISCIIISVSINEVTAQEEWRFRKEKSGVKAYTRKSEHSKIEEYKVTSVINGNVSSFYHLFKDFDRYGEIFEDCSEVNVIHDEVDQHTLYLKINTPFPSRDRDMVLVNKLDYDEDARRLRIDITCTNEHYIPKKKIVQVEECKGFWEIQDLDNGKIDILHQFAQDPGGKIPAFIINLKTVQNPIKSVLAIRELIQMPEYQGRTLPLN